jgi:hypothetical protein
VQFRPVSRLYSLYCPQDRAGTDVQTHRDATVQVSFLPTVGRSPFMRILKVYVSLRMAILKEYP